VIILTQCGGGGDDDDDDDDAGGAAASPPASLESGSLTASSPNTLTKLVHPSGASLRFCSG
jgi:hypothetical protein